MLKVCKGLILLVAGVLFLALTACSPPGNESGAVASVIAELPVAHTNNAVAAIAHNGGATLFSFNGLRAGKTYQDASQMAFSCDVSRGEIALGACRRIADVPVEQGRLASAAVGLGGKVFLFGGYTVAEDGSEVSTPEVFLFDPVSEDYTRRVDMPVPVDDAVAFAYADRYIYLVSGWHDDGNVNLVQVYDVDEDRWFRANDYPGAPVFGHAGGAVGRRFVIADGVAVIGMKDGRRQFGAVDEAWLGEIDADDPAKILWRRLPPHGADSGADGPLYRMAAVGDEKRALVVFAGGADNPYNYDGIGYDGVPAQPSDKIFAYDLDAEKWRALGRGAASMDHRGLLILEDESYVTIGGLDSALAVLNTVISRPAMK